MKRIRLFVVLLILGGLLFAAACHKKAHPKNITPYNITINQCRVLPGYKTLAVNQLDTVEWHPIDGSHYVITFQNSRSPIPSSTYHTGDPPQTIHKDGICMSDPSKCDYTYTMTVDTTPPPPPCADPVIHINP